jgi:hypothetical protein
VTRLALLARRCVFWGDASLTRYGTPTSAAGKRPGRRVAASPRLPLQDNPFSGWVSSQLFVFRRIFSAVRRFLRTLVSTAILAAPVSV